MVPHYIREKNDKQIIVCLLRETKWMDFNCSLEQYNEGVKKYKEGALIQDAFPFLSPDEREFLLTGITSSEWDELFGED